MSLLDISFRLSKSSKRLKFLGFFFPDKPTFVSNQNIVHFDIEVTDKLINQTATLLSLNPQLVAGATTKDGQAISLGTPSALAVWKAE